MSPRQTRRRGRRGAAPPADPALAARLLALRDRDLERRAAVAARGELSSGYAAPLEELHRAQAAELEAIVERRGWPGRTLVGERAAEAAWLVAQHAIARPGLQRRCLELLRAAVAAGEAPASQAAMLEDRIRFNERRPQRYGTICDWDADGRLSPWPVAEPDGLERRRREAGLEPLAAAVERLRARALAEGELPPTDWAARQAEIEAWARRTGWID